MKSATDEYSFILKPSKLGGVGVFVTHDIAKDVVLCLFGDRERQIEFVRFLSAEQVPKIFADYCIRLGDEILAPADFSRMHIGWYLNHSECPNASHEDFVYFTLRDLEAGEEILIDYNFLEEGAGDKEEFYKKE